MAGIGGIYGPGSPLRIDQNSIWRGRDKTNGFLMRNSDGRIPALKQSFSRVDIGASNVIYQAGAVPYGNGLWRDTSNIVNEPGVVKTEAPSVGVLVGIAEFNQGWQTGHPVQNWGVPSFGRADMILAGLVGYKVSMTAVGQEQDYLSYLMGDRNMDDPSIRQVYSDWVAALAAAATGSQLGLFFANGSGFPVMSIVAPANAANPTLAGCTFAGFMATTEPENETVFINLKV